MVVSIIVSWVGVFVVPSAKPIMMSGEHDRDPSKGEGEGLLSVRCTTAPLRSVYEISMSFLPRQRAGGQSVEACVPFFEQRAVVPWMYGAMPWPTIDPDKPRAMQLQVEPRRVHTVGWPCRAFWCTYVWKDSSLGLVLRTIDGLETGPRRGWGYSDRYLLAFPLRIIWPGFLLNSGLVAAAFWAITAGRRRLLATRRARRGHCPRCGYDLLSKLYGGCPECGWGKPPA
jgi:hypothetical protein